MHKNTRLSALLLLCAAVLAASVETETPDDSSSDPAIHRLNSRFKRQPQNQSNSNKCMNNCVTTMIYQPFCGTDNKTYSNPGLLECFQKCGIPVKKKHDGQC